MTLKILTTGGTIDKIYFDRKDAFQVGEPQITQLLQEANVTFDYVVEPLLRKDSLDLTDADRKRIRDHIVADPGRRFLVTHGTDTMAQTARALAGIPHKTVVLTGSMQPARFRTSDAVFNIGFAVAAAQLLPAGVYVAMNGQVFDPERCRKNIDRNRFEDLSAP